MKIQQSIFFFFSFVVILYFCFNLSCTDNSNGSKVITLTGYALVDQGDELTSIPGINVGVYYSLEDIDKPEFTRDYAQTDEKGFYTIEIPVKGENVSPKFASLVKLEENSKKEKFNKVIYLVTKKRGYDPKRLEYQLDIEDINTIDDYAKFEIKDTIILK
jgi:hypothetical protein